VATGATGVDDVGIAGVALVAMAGPGADNVTTWRSDAGDITQYVMPPAAMAAAKATKPNDGRQASSRTVMA
jgi:hypothetical protein